MIPGNNYAEEEKMHKGVIKEHSVKLREQRERERERERKRERETQRTKETQRELSKNREDKGKCSFKNVYMRVEKKIKTPTLEFQRGNHCHGRLFRFICKMET